jgi:tripartite-type tricarboxylate transporter receptor subunit TctC
VTGPAAKTNEGDSMNMQTRIRRFGAAVLVGAAATCAAAAGYPDKPVHFIVGFGAGGGTDSLARIVGKQLSDMWHVPVVVENKAGADGSIAAEAVAQSAPDGYTVAWVSNAHTATPFLRKLSYDPVKSFVPMSLVAYVPDVLVVPASLPVNSLPELIAYAKERPGQLNFGSPGTATAPVPETALLMKLTDIKLVQVAYKSGAEVVQGLIRGDVQMYFGALPTVAPQVKAGKLKALAVAAPARSPAMPDVPTMLEAAKLSGFDGVDWTGTLVAAGTPKEIVDRLSRSMIEAIKSPEVQERFAKLGFVAVADTPEEFRQKLESDIARWGPLLKELGIAK